MANPAPVSLLEYAPAPASLDPAEVVRARARLEAYLKEFWPEIDIRPNSVFGDLFITPAATLVAALEMGLRRFQSDLDLAQVSQGIVFNETFVRAYLKNFGVQDAQSTFSSGLIWLVFSVNREVILQGGLTFSLTTQNTDTTTQSLATGLASSRFWINPGISMPLTIGRVGDTSSSWSLTSLPNGQFGVLLPVQGTPGAVVLDGALFLADQEIPNLAQITASGEFDQGSKLLTVSAMAQTAIDTYPASSLTSRAGLISFFRRQLPAVQWLGATVSGQAEMIRTGYSVLGIIPGAGDVFIRTRETWAEHVVQQTLAYDFLTSAWVGALELPHVPAFFHPSQGVFQGTLFNQQNGMQTLYARSKDPDVDSLGLSYSTKEQLGVRLEKADLNFEDAYLSPVTRLVGYGVNLVVTGIYSGSIFGEARFRNINLRLGNRFTDAEGKEYIPAYASDVTTLQGLDLRFYLDTHNESAIALDTSPEYLRFFQGMRLVLAPETVGVWPSSLGGQQFLFNYKGRTAQVMVSYLFDPLLPNIEATLQDPNYRPVNVSLLARSPLVCAVESLTVYYRVAFGTTIDREQARESIRIYLNSIGYPAVYKDADVSRICEAYGAAAVEQIVKRGRFYPSLASVWENKQGEHEEIPHDVTTSLIPVTNDYGLGLRNMTWYAELSAIQLIAVAT